MTSFAGEADGTVSARFAAIEVSLLRLAVTQLLELLEAASADPTTASVDPALCRLLPDAYTDDPEAAAEFRRFTSDDLLNAKAQNARTVLTLLDGAVSDDALDPPDAAIVLPPAAVQSWLRTLTDLRLTLATRLKISPIGLPQAEGEEALFLGDLYEWLGMVQESLVYAIDA